MTQEQTWNRCKLSGKEECTHKHEEPIRKLNSIEASVSPPDPLDDANPITSSMMVEVDQICSNCEDFQS